MKKRLKLLFLVRDKHGCGFYRMLVPAHEIKRQNLADVKVCYGWNWEMIKQADVIVVQRMPDAQAFEAIDTAQALGKIVVYEIDDYLNGVSPHNPAYSYWSPSAPNLSRALALMKKCNAVQVSTERLRNEYSLWNPNIQVLPNYLDKELWGTPNWNCSQWDGYFKRRFDKIIRIGYVGAGSHYHDLQLVEGILTKLTKRYPNVHLCLMGYHGEKNDGRDLFQNIRPANDTCSTCGQTGQLEKINGIELLQYPSKLRECAFDIGIAPLIETGFNEAKSDLKIKEYAALGIPVVASNITPYKNSVEHNHTGFLALTGKEWYDNLEILIKDKDLRNRLGKNNYQWYRQNTIDKHIHKWISFYTRLVSIKYKW